MPNFHCQPGAGSLASKNRDQTYITLHYSCAVNHLMCVRTNNTYGNMKTRDTLLMEGEGHKSPSQQSQPGNKRHVCMIYVTRLSRCKDPVGIGQKGEMVVRRRPHTPMLSLKRTRISASHNTGTSPHEQFIVLCEISCLWALLHTPGHRAYNHYTI